ncbi:hypothetical protein [Sulfuriferula nivalis]|nr:hypothetical protein [Sulfuriferula nivalis]
MMTFRGVRITILLGVLITLAALTSWERWFVAQWMRPLHIVIYPINGDHNEQVQAYIDALTVDDFTEISQFINQQSARYRLTPIAVPQVKLAHTIATEPPLPPKPPASAVDIALWSLKLRQYVWQNTAFWQSLGQVKLFVVYHQGEDGVALEHSLGLQKGLIGVVHAFAQPQQNAQNNVVITHELLHTLGATDKYDANLQPIYPEGFADVDGNVPHYPQSEAEIMAGRIALSPTHAVMPKRLQDCVIGAKTAFEIQWH